MAVPTNLDMDALRSFVTGLDLGSFAKAAERLGRSASAVSLHLRKLEEQIGRPLVRRAGRGLALTEAGESLIGYARRILALNDEAVTAGLDLSRLEGWARIGLPPDMAETWLPALLAQFERDHPNVRLEVRADRGSAMAEAVRVGHLDLALTWGQAGGVGGTMVARRDIVWIGRDAHVPVGPAPLPLVAFDPPCLFREAAVEGLDEAGLAWRQSFTSSSLAGCWAAVAAGLGVTARTRDGVPLSLRVLDPAAVGLPRLGQAELMLHTGPAALSPPVARLKALLLGAMSLEGT